MNTIDVPGQTKVNPIQTVVLIALSIITVWTKAVRAAGLGVGLYYSPLDWRFPGFFFPDLYMDSAIALRDNWRRGTWQENGYIAALKEMVPA
jgi:hypothetical protein